MGMNEDRSYVRTKQLDVRSFNFILGRLSEVSHSVR
jgi:hypothetical protein